MESKSALRNVMTETRIVAMDAILTAHQSKLDGYAQARCIQAQMYARFALLGTTKILQLIQQYV
jgi:hypothetical protein